MYMETAFTTTHLYLSVSIKIIMGSVKNLNEDYLVTYLGGYGEKEKMS